MKVGILSKARPELMERIPPDLDYVLVAADDDGSYSPQALANLADVEALLVSAEPVHEQLLAGCPKVKIVQRMGVGYNTLVLEDAAKRGIPCCNVAGVNKEAVAEHGMALLLALVKKLKQAHAVTLEGDWAAARVLTRSTFEVHGKTLGIVGFGDTGTSLARRARAFGMRIIYNDLRKIDPAIVAEHEAQSMAKDDLFAAADIVSISTDLNADSLNMVDARRLALMKPTSILICCARGNIVDEVALRDALNEGRIAAAGIDVFSEEPLPGDNPLLAAQNCLLTAHVAGVNPESGHRSFSRALDNVRRVVERGEAPQWVVNGL